MEDKIKENWAGTVLAKGYGILGKIPMIDQRLCIGAKGLYAYLRTFGETVYPGRGKICYDLRISAASYKKYLKELTANGYITVKQQIQAKGRFAHNIYIVEMVPVAVNDRGLNLPPRKFTATENMPPNTTSKTNITKPPTKPRSAVEGDQQPTANENEDIAEVVAAAASINIPQKTVKHWLKTQAPSYLLAIFVDIQKMAEKGKTIENPAGLVSYRIKMDWEPPTPLSAIPLSTAPSTLTTEELEAYKAIAGKGVAYDNTNHPSHCS